MNQSLLTKFKFLFFVSLTLLASCGGGGGGGGSGSDSSATTGIRILHGIVDASPIDLYSSLKPNTLVQTARFADSKLYAALQQGVQNITIKPHLTTSAALYTSSLTVEKNQHTSVLFFGSEAAFGLNATLISDQHGEIGDGLSAIKVAHALIGAAGLSAQIGTESLGSKVAYGTASDYAYVPAGLNTFIVRRSSDGRVVSQDSYELQPGKAYTVLVTGEIDYLVVNRFLED